MQEIAAGAIRDPGSRSVIQGGEESNFGAMCPLVLVHGRLIQWSILRQKC